MHLKTVMGQCGTFPSGHLLWATLTPTRGHHANLALLLEFYQVRAREPARAGSMETKIKKFGIDMS